MPIAALLLFSAASWTPLVQIGAFDRDTRDLALGPGSYARYSNDPVFVAGFSQAGRDWPYVIPGPGDAWAGTRTHTFEIRFGLGRLSPQSRVRLRAAFVETHPTNPPHFALLLNGEPAGEWSAPPGRGDAAVLGHPEQGRPVEWTPELPASALREGANRLDLVSTRGSWAVFDAVAVEGEDVSSAPLPPGLEVSAAPPGETVRNTSSGPAREVAVRVVNAGPPTRGELTLDGRRFAADFPTGATDLPELVPATPKPREVALSARADDGRQAAATLALAPVRPWRVLIFPGGHVDVGYTHPQEIVAQIQAQNVRDALGLVEATRSRPAGERYRWNSETAWSVEQFLKTASPADRARLSRAVAAGEIGISSSYMNMLYGLCRPEELLRSQIVVRPDAGLEKAPWDTATLSDAPGFPWGLATALSQAGVRNFLYWPNAGDVMRPKLENRPFWWQTRDGHRRIFVWPMAPYSLGTDLKGVFHIEGTWYPNRPHAIRTADPSQHFLGDWLPSQLKALREQGYPYDLLGIPWSMGDNGAIDLDLPDAVAQWNRRYAWPKLEIVSLSEGCRRFLSRYGAKLPTLAADFGPQWEDGAESSAHETALNRNASERLAQAEIAWALRRPAAFPRARFGEAWRNVLAYSEHTWGADESVRNPDSENTRRQWAAKAAFAADADRESRALLNEAAGTPAASTFGVLNTALAPRTGLVEVEGTRGVADEHGRPVPCQRLSDGKVAFLARAVPGLGSARFRRTGTAPASNPAAGNAVENEFYRVEVDRATGAIASLRSLRLGRELVNRSASQGFGQYGYILGNDPSRMTALRDVRVETVDRGPLVWTLRVTGRADGVSGEVERTIRLVKGVDAVEIAVRFDKAPVREKEIAFLSFPFALQRPEVTVEGSWAPYDVARQHFPAANDQFFSVNRWIHLQDAHAGVTVVTEDTPIVVLGNPSVARLGRPQPFDPHGASLHFQLAQNHWHVNYRAFQSGPQEFRFVLRADAAPDPGADARLGELYARPLMAASEAPAEVPFAVDGQAELSALQPAPNGGWLIRLYGASGKDAAVTIRPRPGQKLRIFESDGTGRLGRETASPLRLPAFAVRTWRIAPPSSPPR